MALRNADEVVRRKDYYDIDPRSIRVESGWNQRKDFSGHEEIKASIAANGVYKPLLVRRDDDGPVLVDGERRLRAVLDLIAEGHKIEAVPAIYERRTISQPEAMFAQIVSNDGKPFTAPEEGAAFRQLLGWGVDKAEIARRIGRSSGYVSDRLALVDAAPVVQQAVAEKKITIGRAKRIVKEHREPEEQAAAMAEPQERTCDLAAVYKVLELELKWMADGKLSDTQKFIGRQIIERLKPLL